MKEITLPKTALVCNLPLRLHWQTLATLNGWYAEISPQRVRLWEEDPAINMRTIEQELGNYGNYARYGQDSNGKTWLCVYILA